MKRTRIFQVWIFLSLFFFTLSSFGQAVSGTLLGTVQDTTGANVANAKVTATNTATSTVYESVTNDAGNYTVPNLPPGTYSVAAWYEGETRASRSVMIPPQGGPVDLDFDLP